MIDYGAISNSFIGTEDPRSSVRSSGSNLSRRSSSIIDVQAFPAQEGKASISSEVASITKNLAGAGVLSLSGGIALFANDPAAMLSASVWVFLLGLMFGYYGLLIAKVCHKTQSSTYRECWEATHDRGGLAVAIISTLLPAQGNVSYATVLSQTLQSLLETVDVAWSRIHCLLFITTFALLPLCLMKDLDALAPFSVLGIVAVCISILSMLIRCFDGSYQPGGQFYDSISEELRPSLGNSNDIWSLKVLPYVCMVFQAWVFHYNVPRLYAELENATIPRFGRAITYSFVLAAIMYIVIAAAGFWTFGGNAASYILNNYSPNDPLATTSRIGIFISTLLIYPLAFFGVRAGLLDVLQIPYHRQTTTYLNLFSTGLLTCLTCLSIVFHDLGLINAIGGGAFATFLCIIFPTLMYRQAVRQQESGNRDEEAEVSFAVCLMCIGTILGFVGVCQSIWEANGA